MSRPDRPANALSMAARMTGFDRFFGPAWFAAIFARMTTFDNNRVPARFAAMRYNLNAGKRLWRSGRPVACALSMAARIPGFTMFSAHQFPRECEHLLTNMRPGCSLRSR
jgi:hypothetical protein